MTGDIDLGFNSWRDFENFRQDTKYKNRFFHSTEVSEFLSNIKLSLPDRERTLSSGKILYRSQIGYEEYESEGQLIVQGFPVERMKPIPNNGVEGRANPKGISYMYLSNDENTALSELRPHISQYISLAQFRILKDLKIVDCYSVPRRYSYIQCLFNAPASQEEIRNAVWSMINATFTKPVTNTDQHSDYVPTQVLAEYFKSEGYDGVCYKSRLGGGYNFILFCLEDADLINCTVMEAKSISYVFEECANRYFVPDGQKR